MAPLPSGTQPSSVQLLPCGQGGSQLKTEPFDATEPPHPPPALDGEAWDAQPGSLATAGRKSGRVRRLISVNSSSEPSSSVGTEGSGSSQPNSDALPWYCTRMCAVVTPSFTAKTSCSPACNT